MRTGLEVERAVYKLLDKNTGEYLVPEIENGFLMSEWLTIVRIKDRESFKVVLGGMHGYSTEEFSRNITSNIEKLKSIVGSDEQYQVIVPVILTHGPDSTGRVYTHGEINWSKARKHTISV